MIDIGFYGNSKLILSATKCNGDNGICCGDILSSMDEIQYIWPYNHYYICLPNKDCFIDCNHIDNTNNLYSNFSCNTKQSIINATHSTSLTELCHDGDIGSCHNLTVLCPKGSNNKLCNVSCNGENGGCNLLNIDTQQTKNLY